MNGIPKVKQAKIIKRKIAEPEFKKPRKIAGLEFLHNYYKDLDNAASKGRFVYYVLRKYNRADGYGY